MQKEDRIQRLFVEKTRIYIEIMSFIMVLVFDSVLIFRLLRSGLRAISFYLNYFNIPMNPFYFFSLAVFGSLTVLYISIKAIIIFYKTLTTELFISEKGLLLKSGKNKYHISPNESDTMFNLHSQPIPKLTLGKRLQTVKIHTNGKSFLIAYEYLLDPDKLLNFINLKTDHI